MNAGSFRAGVLTALVLGSPLGAHAQPLPTCSGLPNPVYMKIANTQRPFMQRLGRVLADQTHPITLVYLPGQSCPNIDEFYGDTPIMAGANAFYIPSSAASPGWDPSTFVQCTVSADQPFDVGNSVVMVDQCGEDPDSPPPGIGLFDGPVQPYGFVVPKASSQRAITAEAAYFVFGFPNGDGQVAPWSDDTFKIVMGAGAGTQISLGQSIGVHQNRWRGASQATPVAVRDAVLASASLSPEKTIGILASEVYDPVRGQLNMLAFQAYGQERAYWPDSTADAVDKRNVRDGHYTLWSPTVWMARVDGSGVPVSSDVAYVIDSILGRSSGHRDASDIASEVSLVPSCAMEVQRHTEGGPLSINASTEPCGCHYEATVTGQAPADCVRCDDSTPCSTGTCRRGFCEATQYGLCVEARDAAREQDGAR